MKKKFLPMLLIFIVFLIFGVFIINKNNNISTTPAKKMSVQIAATILTDLTKNGMSCDLKNSDGVNEQDGCTVDIVLNDYAKGLMPQAYWIAKKINNTWTIVVTGNGIPQCKEIDTNKIPKEIFGNCIEATGELRYKT